MHRSENQGLEEEVVILPTTPKITWRLGVSWLWTSISDESEFRAQEYLKQGSEEKLLHQCESSPMYFGPPPTDVPADTERSREGKYHSHKQDFYYIKGTDEHVWHLNSFPGALCCAAGLRDNPEWASILTSGPQRDHSTSSLEDKE